MRSRRLESPLAFLAGALSGALLYAIWLELAPAEAQDLRLYRHVRDLVLGSYVREVQPGDLADRALEGMVGSLDPYSSFMTGEDAARVERETAGSYTGVGLILRPPVSDGQVLFALDGSPADGAGVRPGDRILRVGGRPFSQLQQGEFAALLRSPGASSVAVEIESHGIQRTIELQPGTIVEPSVRHARLLEEGIGLGYLAITSFTRETAAEFDRAAADLRARGMRSLVLDLRSNPGGVLDAAIDVASRFVESGEIAATKSRRGRQAYGVRANPMLELGMPLVVLLDNGSASASEVLAGALQDHRAAVVLGEPSYGKSMVQTVERIPGAEALVRLTTSVYSTPSGRVLLRSDANGHGGLAPDVMVSIAPADRERLHAWLQSYDPPDQARLEIEEWERLEHVQLLPAPGADLQLAAAIELLQGRRGPSRASEGTY